MNKISLASLLLVVILAVVACAAPAAPVPPTAAPTAIPPTSVPPTAAPTAAPAAKEATLKVVQDATLGQFLADDQGRILYLFTKDTKDTSNCYDACATAWPPLLSAGQPKGMDGVNASLLGTTQRKDNSVQVTYNGWPLYYYVKDQKPGDTTGQGVGNVWYVISPAGAIVKAASLKIVQDATLGQFLADDQGRTLYLFTKDTKDTSNCYDACATAWPPLLTAGQAKVGEGIDAGLLGTTQRKDGSIQVTYNGFPLYYYVKDQKPGDIQGQGVGNVWYVISPAGAMIKAATSSMDATPQGQASYSPRTY
jgi:predicted lipoprotein with Yx(FWY)xxD motif